MLKNLLVALVVLSVVLMYTEAAAVDAPEPSNRFFFFALAKARCFTTCVCIFLFVKFSILLSKATILFSHENSYESKLNQQID